MEYYIARLREGLEGLPMLEKDAIVEEVRLHVRERAHIGNVVDGELLANTLRELGEPRDVAQKYKARAWLLRASKSWSPLTILRATISWAALRGKGVRAGLILLVGYGVAFVFLLCASLEQFLPEAFENWVGSAAQAITGSSTADNSGPIAVPGLRHTFFEAAVGIIFLIATTYIVRALIRQVATPAE